MTEQTAAFLSLESLTTQLIAALVRNEPAPIENLARNGEAELRKMRSRLLEITNSLTTFSELNRSEYSPSAIGPDVRDMFESAANNLLEAARKYQKISKRTESLAVGGSSFATACIQICGVLPSTYSAPVLKSAIGGLSK
jgi:hypothetical protein